MLFCDEFDKMQIPYMREYNYTQSVYGLFGDDWDLRFCALITVGALFVFNARRTSRNGILGEECSKQQGNCKNQTK